MPYTYLPTQPTYPNYYINEDDDDYSIKYYPKTHIHTQTNPFLIKVYRYHLSENDKYHNC